MKRKLRARSKMYIKETYSQSDIEKRDRDASTSSTQLQRDRKLNIENVNEKGIFFLTFSSWRRRY